MAPLPVKVNGPAIPVREDREYVMVTVAWGLVPVLTIEGHGVPKTMLASCNPGFRETAAVFAADRAVVGLPVIAITRTPSRAAADSEA